MSAPNAMESKVADHILGTASYTMPADVYLALFTAAPGEAGGGTEVTASNGYARALITFGAAVDGLAESNLEVVFTASGGNWGTVTHFAIMDASTSGNMITYAQLDEPRIVNNGDSIKFRVGDVKVQVD